MFAEFVLTADIRPRANPLRVLLEMYQRTRERRALAALDARLLEDVGLTRADVAREASKPFWV